MNRRAFVTTSVAATAAGTVAFAAEGAPKKYVLPAGIKGFKGMATGTIVKMGKGEMLVKIDAITKVWKHNKAKDPKCIVGKNVPMDLYKKGRLYKKQLETMKTLKVGDRILCEPFHMEGEHLTIIEELKKIAKEEKKEGKELVHTLLEQRK